MSFCRFLPINATFYLICASFLFANPVTSRADRPAERTSKPGKSAAISALDPAALRRHPSSPRLEIEIPETFHPALPEKSLKKVSLELIRSEIFSEKYQAESVSAEGLTREVLQAKHPYYRGEVVASSDQGTIAIGKARISYSGGSLKGVIAINHEKNITDAFELTTIGTDATAKGLLISVERRSDKLLESGTLHTNIDSEALLPPAGNLQLEAPQLSSDTQPLADGASLRRLDVATEADCHLVEAAGGVTQANYDIMGAMDWVALVYEIQLGLDVIISYQHFWESCIPEYPYKPLSGHQLLTQFGDWWNLHIRPSHSFGVAHLFAHDAVFTEPPGMVGLAWLGTACSNLAYSWSWINGPGRWDLSALIVAHEIGHNLGAAHDWCPDSTFRWIMCPFVTDIDQFSPGTKSSITSYLGQVSCLPLVSGSNHRPILNPVTIDVEEGQTTTVPLTVTDAGNDFRDIVPVSLPAGVTLLDNALTIAPGYNAVSCAPSVELTARLLLRDHAGHSTMENVLITVRNYNQPPELNLPAELWINSRSDFAFPLDVSDPDGDPVSTYFHHPEGYVYENVLHIYKYFIFPSRNFTFEARDCNGASVTKSLVAHSYWSPDLPIFYDPEPLYVLENQAVSFSARYVLPPGVTEEDISIDSASTWLDYGSFTVSGKSVTFTPSFSAATRKIPENRIPVSVVYKNKKTGESDTYVQDIYVRNVPRAPHLTGVYCAMKQNGQFYYTPGSSITLCLYAARDDSDDQSNLQFSVSSSIPFSLTNVLTYAADAKSDVVSDIGTISVTVTVTDTHGLSETSVLTLEPWNSGDKVPYANTPSPAPNLPTATATPVTPAGSSQPVVKIAARRKNASTIQVSTYNTAPVSGPALNSCVNDFYFSFSSASLFKTASTSFSPDR